MTSEKFLEILNDIDSIYVEEAMKFKKRIYVKWIKYSVCAACLLLFVSIVSKGLSSEIQQLPNVQNAENISATIKIGDRIALYKQIDVNRNEIKKMIGRVYLQTDSEVWFYKVNANSRYQSNLKYLIHKNKKGEYRLWVFRGFLMENGETYTYGEVMKTIYGVNSAADIISIAIKNSMDMEKTIQSGVGTCIYTDRDDIREFYKILNQIECYGIDAKYQDKGNYLTNQGGMLVGKEDIDEIRKFELTLSNGETIDSWKYDVSAGVFFEEGGIFTKTLNDEDMYKLNEILGLQ